MGFGFELGYNGNFDDLKKICAHKTVKTVYTGGLRNKISGGRAQFMNSMEGIAMHVNHAHKNGIEFLLALNSPCTVKDKSEGKWWQQIISYIKEIEAAGVDGVIISHPFLMELVKEHTKMKLVVSTISDISNARAAKFYEDFGADVIIPSVNINYKMDILKKMKTALKKATLRLLVNEPCLADCPWKRFHLYYDTNTGNGTDYISLCSRKRMKDPYLLLNSNVIRPEDLHFYNGITHDFKIVCRTVNIDFTLEIIEAYSSGTYNGNYIKIAANNLAHIVFVDNSRLNGLGEKKLNCTKVCASCSYCHDLSEEVIQFNLMQ